MSKEIIRMTMIGTILHLKNDSEPNSWGFLLKLQNSGRMLSHL